MLQCNTTACQPSLSVVYCSNILQYITTTSRQYTAISRACLVVYYSILQNITATSRGYLTVIQYYNAYDCQPSLSVVYYSILQYITATIRLSAGPVCSNVVYYSTSRQYGYQPGLSVYYRQARG